jgi:triosephosphate isomerase
MNIMFCIGETLAERKAGDTESVLRKQITEGLAGLTPAQMQHLVIAYEPVWAIGTNEAATPELAEEAQAFTRTVIKELFGTFVSESIRIQYGGGVKPDSAAALIAQEDIDGFLVGGASLTAESFAGIIASAE